MTLSSWKIIYRISRKKTHFVFQLPFFLLLEALFCSRLLLLLLLKILIWLVCGSIIGWMNTLLWCNIKCIFLPAVYFLVFLLQHFLSVLWWSIFPCILVDFPPSLVVFLQLDGVFSVCPRLSCIFPWGWGRERLALAEGEHKQHTAHTAQTGHTAQPAHSTNSTHGTHSTQHKQDT